MTRPEPARMRIVPEVATEEMVMAAGISLVHPGVYMEGAPPVVLKRAARILDSGLDAAPSAGLVSREMVERVARALAPIAWAALGTGDTLAQQNRRKASLRHATTAIAALGLTVAPAADTAREREGG